MATFALIHGGGGSAWDWHLVARELRDAGHDPTAVDLPCEDESAGWWRYADAVVGSIGNHSELVVVGHSLAPSPRRSSAPAFRSTCSSWSRQ